MTYVVRTNDGTDHEVTDVTDSGNYVTKCENLFVKQVIEEVLEDIPVTCAKCLAPPKPVEPPRPRRIRPPGAKPQWRQARNLRGESVQGAQFAHKEIVAALEWFQRGVEDQFTDQALDRIHLSYRFLKEILIAYGRIQDDTPPEAE